MPFYMPQQDEQQQVRRKAINWEQLLNTITPPQIIGEIAPSGGGGGDDGGGIEELFSGLQGLIGGISGAMGGKGAWAPKASGGGAAGPTAAVSSYRPATNMGGNMTSPAGTGATRASNGYNYQPPVIQSSRPIGQQYPNNPINRPAQTPGQQYGYNPIPQGNVPPQQPQAAQAQQMQAPATLSGPAFQSQQAAMQRPTGGFAPAQQQIQPIGGKPFAPAQQQPMGGFAPRTMTNTMQPPAQISQQAAFQRPMSNEVSMDNAMGLSQSPASTMGYDPVSQAYLKGLQRYGMGDFSKSPAGFMEKVQGVQDSMRAAGFDPIVSEVARSQAQANRNAASGVGIKNSQHVAGRAADIVDARYGWDGSPEFNSQYAAAQQRAAAEQGLYSGRPWKNYGPEGDFAHVQYPTSPAQKQFVDNYNIPKEVGNSQQVAQQGIPMKPTNNPYIDSALSGAKAAYGDDSVRAQLAASQAIHESGLSSGKPSKLASDYNNYFGIKGEGDAGSVMMTTKEYVNGKMRTVKQPFAVYSSPQAAFTAHKNLMSKGRYKGVMDAKSFEDAATAVKASGYATDPNYTKYLNNTYNKYIKPYWE